MRWWIDVRSPLPDVRENLREKPFAERSASLFIPIGGLPLLVGKSLPFWDAWPERVRQVYKPLSSEDLVYFQQGGLSRWSCRGREEHRGEKKVLRAPHLALLNDPPTRI